MAKAIINGQEIFGNVKLGEGGDVANPNIADVYDPTQTYNTGDRRIYDNVLYVCNDDNVTGAWDSTKWDSATIDEIISALTADDIEYSSGVSVADKLDEVPTLASDTVSVSSGVTANKIQLLKYGKVVFLTMAIKVSSPSSWQVIGTIPNAYFPKWSIFGVMINTTSANNLQTAHINIEPDGRIRLANTLPDSRDTYTFDLTWIIE